MAEVERKPRYFAAAAVGKYASTPTVPVPAAGRCCVFCGTEDARADVELID